MNKRISSIDVLWLAAIFAAYLGLCLCIRYPHDDAFITFRYSRNLVNGYGLVYNPGFERVEGYTNFLWMLLVCPAFLLGLPPLVFARLLGAAAGMGLIAAAFWFARRSFEKSGWMPRLVALALAVNLSLASWAMTGLETNLFALFTFLGVVMWRYEKGGRGTGWLWGAVFGVAALTRPEGWAMAGLVWAFEFLLLLTPPKFLGDRKREFPWKPLIRGTAVFALIFVPYFVWRYSYFGYLFPNAFYAKVGITPWTFVRGARYTGSFINRYNLFFILFLPAAYRWRELLRDESVRLAAWYFAFWTFYATAVGGDHMSFYRFLVPAVPLAVFLSAKALNALLKSRGASLRAAAVAAAFLLWCLPWLNPRIYEDIAWNRHYMPSWIVAGKALAKYAHPGETLAITTAGMIPYYSDLETIDMFGLNDLHIAHIPVELGRGSTAGHEKSDWRYIMAREPDYFVDFPWVTPSPGRGWKEASRWLKSEFSKKIFNSGKFRRKYRIISIPTDDGRYFNLFKKIK